MIEPYAEGFMSGFYEYSDKDNLYEFGTLDHTEWNRGNLDLWCEYGDMQCAS